MFVLRSTYEKACKEYLEENHENYKLRWKIQDLQDQLLDVEDLKKVRKDLERLKNIQHEEKLRIYEEIAKEIYGNN